VGSYFPRFIALCQTAKRSARGISAHIRTLGTEGAAPPAADASALPRDRLPSIEGSDGFAASEGGLRSWLGVRCTRTPALYFAAPPSCGCYAVFPFAGRKPQSANSSPRMRAPDGRRETPMAGPAQRVAEAEPSGSAVPVLEQTGLADRTG
jgi:hypothetical protein